MTSAPDSPSPASPSPSPASSGARPPLGVRDVLALSPAELRAIIDAAAPLDLDALADTRYTGIDLSLPGWATALLWKTFRKTFHRDPATGVLRGWNVKVAQTGWETPPEPLRDGRGRARTFGHYEVRSARGLPFPRGWEGAHYLDYRFAGNRFADWPSRAAYCPLVAVNPGSMDLLLGWEVFRIAGTNVPIPDHWLLVREGPLAPDEIEPRPDARGNR